MIAFMSISNALAFLAEMVHDPTDDKSTLVQVMARCRRAKLVNVNFWSYLLVWYMYTYLYLYIGILSDMYIPA